jgi:hypothetical protein
MPASRSDSVDFELIDHRHGADSKYSWLPPFDWTVVYENERWWDEPRHYYVGEPWFVQVLEDGDEVARVELDDPGGINPQYTGVPELGAERLEIQFIASTPRPAAVRVQRGGAQVLGLARLGTVRPS